MPSVFLRLDERPRPVGRVRRIRGSLLQPVVDRERGGGGLSLLEGLQVGRDRSVMGDRLGCGLPDELLLGLASRFFGLASSVVFGGASCCGLSLTPGRCLGSVLRLPLGRTTVFDFSGQKPGLLFGGASCLVLGLAPGRSLLFGGASRFGFGGPSRFGLGRPPGLFLRGTPGLCLGFEPCPFLDRLLGLRFGGAPGAQLRFVGVDHVALDERLPLIRQAGLQSARRSFTSRTPTSLPEHVLDGRRKRAGAKASRARPFGQVRALPRASSFTSKARRSSSPVMSPVRRGIGFGSARAMLTISPLRSP